VLLVAHTYTYVIYAYVHDLANVRNCDGIVCFSLPHVAYATKCYAICPTKVGEMPQRFSGKENIAGENAEK